MIGSEIRQINHFPTALISTPSTPSFPQPPHHPINKVSKSLSVSSNSIFNIPNLNLNPNPNEARKARTSIFIFLAFGFLRRILLRAVWKIFQYRTCIDNKKEKRKERQKKTNWGSVSEVYEERPIHQQKNKTKHLPILPGAEHRMCTL